jgi:hypothetical protein
MIYDLNTIFVYGEMNDAQLDRLKPLFERAITQVLDSERIWAHVRPVNIVRIERQLPGSPGARSTDPSTSRKAALENAPRAKTQRAFILNHLCFLASGVVDRRGNPRTSAQIGRYCNLRGAWKRVSDLHEGGWIEVVGEETDPDTRMKVQLYAPTEKAMAWYNEGQR